MHTTPHRRLKRAAALVAVLATAGGVALYHARDGAAPGHRGPLSLSPGERLVYSARLDSNIDAPSGRVGHLRVTGRYVVERLPNCKRACTLAHFEDVRFESELADPQARARMQASSVEFEQPIAFEVGTHGELGETHESPKTSVQVRTLAKSVAAMAQFVSVDGAGDSWTTQELDTTGRYEASYRKGAATRFEKRKTRYLELLGSSDAFMRDKAGITVTRSSYAFELEGTHVASLRADEELLASGSYVEGIRTRTALELKLVEVGKTRASQGKTALEVASLSKHAGQGTTFSAGADAARVGGRTFGQIIEGLEALPEYEQRSDAEKREGRVLFSALAAKMRLEDSAVDEALREIKDGSARARTLWDAMSTAGTLRAQAALRELIELKDFTMPERRMQMVALSMVKTPAQESVQFLYDKFGDEQQGIQARYGVGTAVFNLKDKFPEAAEDAFQILAEELAKETDVAKKAALLEALGNTGYPKAFALVSPYLKAPQTELRRAAAQGLRLIPGTHCDEALARVLDTEEVEIVRISAVDAFSTREPNEINLNALVSVVENDPSEITRKGARKVLAEFSTREPRVAKALQEYEAHGT
jgi:HEAT repeat protein